MAYDATAIEIMIASPGDVSKERQVVREVIAVWNAVYARDRGVVLLPVGWETHSSPELAGRPQQMINDRLLAHTDILVGIFSTRVGSPTGKAISGTIEEIEEHLHQGKPAMLYFSNAPVVPDSIDQDQYLKLREFKAWARLQGLVEVYEGADDFYAKFQRQLPVAFRDNDYLKGILTKPSAGAIVPEPSRALGFANTLSEESKALLAAAVESGDGLITISRHMGGTTIQAGGQNFGKSDVARSVARWEAAVNDLEQLGLIRDPRGKGEVFSVNDAGYKIIESGSR